MSWIDSVIDFWFRELKPEQWFNGGPKIDALIRARFGDLYAALMTSPPNTDALTAIGHLAAVIVFDQFPRNIHRDSAAAFATDPRALALSMHAVDHRLDEALGPHERHFLYLPFMHSEDPAMQARSIELFGSLNDPEILRYARSHQAIVDRFGRFPHRNKALGRISTREEEVFLKDASSNPSA